MDREAAFDEKKLEVILETADFLASRGRHDMALEFLLDGIWRCEKEREAVGEGAKSGAEKLEKIKSLLEYKYLDLRASKGAPSLKPYLIKVAATMAIISIAVIITVAAAIPLVERMSDSIIQKGLTGAKEAAMTMPEKVMDRIGSWDKETAARNSEKLAKAARNLKPFTDELRASSIEDTESGRTAP